MKKLFFSAVALVAFSSVSMANTIAEKDIIDESKTTVACCTVGTETWCGEANEPLCDNARRAYCAKRRSNCTSTVRESVGLAP